VKEPAIHPRLYTSLVLPRWQLGFPTASQSLPSIGFAPRVSWRLGISRTAFARGRYRSAWPLAWKTCPSSQSRFRSFEIGDGAPESRASRHSPRFRRFLNLFFFFFISQSPSHSLGSGRSRRTHTGARLHPGALLRAPALGKYDF
jgi:hypothetical protein